VNIFAHVMMYGWPLFSITFFKLFSRNNAILFTIFFGFLFLPQIAYDVPVLFEYNKSVSITLGLVLGRFSLNRSINYLPRIGKYDIPMILWCFFSPLVTSLVNGLGIKDGIVSMEFNFFTWGVFFWAGRLFYRDKRDLRSIITALIFSGFIYSFFALLEIRMSPQLSNHIYFLHLVQ